MILDPAVCQRAVESRDPRFDGVFFVGVTTTHIYCRPICPARVSYPSHRRFFDSVGAAEAAGFRPCLRCRPELAPGLALCDRVSTASYHLDDVSVSSYGDVALVRAKGSWVAANGKRGVSRYVDVYVRSGDAWKVVSAQITRPPSQS